MPENKNKKFYVTSAIAYPNSKPHIGHALEIVEADVVARFHKLLGEDVFFQTGTDEHGTKNWETAKKQGKDVKELLDANVQVFKDLYKKLNISYDQFIRTTDKDMHQKGVVKLWQELEKAGDIYKKKYKGQYCSGCESFKTERELEDGKCPNHPTKEIETVEEENYFFKLSKYKDELIKKIKSDEYKVVPEIRKNEILSFLPDAKDISFSRPKSSLPWGIEVPNDPEQVMYVWCDALSNYLTGAGYGRDEKQLKETWPADVHIIGKDILRFHAAFWPAMLISAKVQLPKELLVHGFVLSRGKKMGKSTGNVIEPFEQIEKYGVDQFRYYMLGSMPLGEDGDYSEDLVMERVNTELLANLSNFCYRVLSFTNKNFDSEIKEIDNSQVIEEIRKKIEGIKKLYEGYDFKRAIDETLAVSALGNKYFQDNAPWKLINEDKPKAHKVIGTAINIAKNLSILIQPIMPNFASELQEQLNVKDLKWSDIDFKLIDHKINKAKIVINKIEKVEEEKFPLDLKVAKIEKVSDHPEADKLYILDIDLGEKRQIVAGVKEHYKKEELEGKNITIVANLKPAKLRGIMSQGMLLAAEHGEKVKVLFNDGNPGDGVQFGEMKNNNQQIKYDEFAKLKILVKDKKVICNGLVLNIKGKDITIDIEDNAEIG